MGKIKEIINGLDQSKETEKEIGEQLKILSSLGSSKVDIFRGEIELSLKDGKTTDDLKVPITKVLGSYEEYRAYTNRTQDELMKNVVDSIRIMFSGEKNDILNGIGGLITKGLSVILGAGSGEEMQRKEYYVVVEYPAIIRYDIAMWTRNISVKALQERAQNIIACVAYKSAVDVTQLDFNTFLGCYSNVLSEAFGSDRSNIKEMISEAAEVFGLFKNQEGTRASAEKQIDRLTDYVIERNKRA